MTQRIGRYEIERAIPGGGMADVYLARDPGTERQVVVKVIKREYSADEEFRARFKREAKTVAALEHPAIVPAYEFDEHEGQPFIAMRYMPGGSLLDRLRHGPLALPDIARIVERIADALDEAHEHGIIHRDLKPGNILFDAKDNAYLSDFGIAKKIADASTASLTGTGFIGTPAYASPEQITAKTQLDGRTDVYSLGVIVFELLTGKLPYEAGTPMGIAFAHVNDPIPNILSVKPDLPRACSDFIKKALAKNREKRFKTASELARELNKIVQSVKPAKAERAPLLPFVPKAGKTPTPEPPKSAKPERILPSPIAPKAVKTPTPEPPKPAKPEKVLPPPIAPIAQKPPTPEPPKPAKPEKAPTPPKASKAEKTPTPPSTPKRRAAATQPDGDLRPAGLVVEPPPTIPVRPLPAWLVPVAIVAVLGIIAVVGSAFVLPALSSQRTPKPTTQVALLAATDSSPAPTETPKPSQIQAIEPTITPTLAPTLSIGSTKISEKDEMVQMYVPEGEFLMGSAESDPNVRADEKPQHTVYLDAFWIDQTKVTNTMFAACVAASVCKPTGVDPSEKPNHPVVFVSWNNATTYCQWVGRRLPTEAEWEKAARGADGRLYPWGNDSPDSSLLNFNQKLQTGTTLVADYPNGASPYGALDMAGNVYDWVTDWYGSSYYSDSSAKNPTGPESSDMRVTRGGSWFSAAPDVRSATRNRVSPDFWSSWIGFRCAQSAAVDFLSTAATPAATAATATPSTTPTVLETPTLSPGITPTFRANLSGYWELYGVGTTSGCTDSAPAPQGQVGSQNNGKHNFQTPFHGVVQTGASISGTEDNSPSTLLTGSINGDSVTFTVTDFSAFHIPIPSTLSFTGTRGFDPDQGEVIRGTYTGQDTAGYGCQYSGGFTVFMPRP